MDLLSEKEWIQIFINPWGIIKIMILLIGLEWCITKWIISKKKGTTKIKAAISFLTYLSAFFGVLSMVYDNRNYVLHDDIDIMQQCIEIDFQRDFLNRLDWLESYHAKPFVRSEFSPPNFNELQQERQNFHNWICEHKCFLINNINNLEYIETDSIQFPYDKLTDRIYIDDITYIKKNITEYNIMLNKLTELKQRSNNDPKRVFSFLYPLFFVIALSLQITKDFFLKQNSN